MMNETTFRRIVMFLWGVATGVAVYTVVNLSKLNETSILSCILGVFCMFVFTYFVFWSGDELD